MKCTIDFELEVQMSLFSPSQLNRPCLRRFSVAVPYTFSVNQNGGRPFVNFCRALLVCSLIAHIDPPRTLYGRFSRCLGGLAAI